MVNKNNLNKQNNKQTKKHSCILIQNNNQTINQPMNEQAILNVTLNMNRNSEQNLQHSLSRLNEISKLEDNWNNEGAKGFVHSFKLINTVKLILEGLELQPFVCPTMRNSIQLEYEKPNGDYLEFEIFGDGYLVVFIYLHTGCYKEKDLNIDAHNSSFDRLISLMNNLISKFIQDDFNKDKLFNIGYIDINL